MQPASKVIVCHMALFAYSRKSVLGAMDQNNNKLYEAWCPARSLLAGHQLCCCCEAEPHSNNTVNCANNFKVPQLCTPCCARHLKLQSKDDRCWTAQLLHAFEGLRNSDIFEQAVRSRDCNEHDWLPFQSKLCELSIFGPDERPEDLTAERKKAYAGRNQRALRKDHTVSAVTDHESHQYLN
eukprot:1158354-Pelagomonas_calceolata.AAC.1